MSDEGDFPTRTIWKHSQNQISLKKDFDLENHPFLLNKPFDLCPSSKRSSVGQIKDSLKLFGEVSFSEFHHQLICIHYYISQFFHIRLDDIIHHISIILIPSNPTIYRNDR